MLGWKINFIFNNKILLRWYSLKATKKNVKCTEVAKILKQLNSLKKLFRLKF